MQANHDAPAGSHRDVAGPLFQQSDLFEQYTRVLRQLARRRPLLLLLDDLQWADAGSVSLLFHLGKRLTGDRILIVGAYRPTEVALGRGGERHPLEPVLADYGQRVMRLVDPAGADTGLLGHVLKVFLVDEFLRIRNVYSAGLMDARLILNDIQTVLAD